MDKKRALDDAPSPAGKRPRNDAPSAGPGGSAAGGVDTAALIAQKKAEIAAKLAAMKRPGGSVGAAVSAAPVPAPAAAGSSTADDLARRVAEAKARVAAAQNRVQAPASARKKTAAAPATEPVPQGGGLNMAAHPLLLNQTPSVPQSKKDRYKPMQPKFATIKANIRNVPTPPPQAATPVAIVPVAASANPYTAAASTAAAEGAIEGQGPRERVGRNFRFNQKGKYVALGDQLRKDAKLEEIKQRIADSARKAGLDGQFETVEKSIKREAPPAAEWWDEPLLPNNTYDDLALGMGALNIGTSDSPITIYVQHPIPIPAPGDKAKPALKPLKLTTKEQKKMRKSKRAAALQDHRDRVRMGLIPPDPPKVRLANLMKVLTSDAVQDPTKVEARVRREVAMRKHTHEKTNAERKLTDDQRREKIEEKKTNEEKKGVWGAVFRVKTLSDPAHRFKVRKNAEQLGLTGVCLFHPTFALVFVEGASKFVNNYKRLMLKRIVWTEAARPRGVEDVEIDAGEDGAAGPSTKPAPAAEGAAEEEAPPSLEDNRCDLVWEGQLRERTFGNFKPKACPTDHLAKETLGTKLAGYWDAAKNFKPAEDELF